jgi:cell division protease FtsH
MNEAINKVITKNIRKPDKDAEFHRLVAIHEIGHVVAEYIYNKTISIKVTNYSYGDAGGFTQPGDTSQGIITEEKYKAKVFGLLGGRAAEEAILGYVTTGASEDFSRARAMVERFYNTYYFDSYRYAEFDQVVLDTLEAWYSECVTDFKGEEMQELINELTTSLIKNRVLYTKDIAAIISKYPVISSIAKP